MKWSEFNKEIANLSPEEKTKLELLVVIASVRKSKHLSQEQFARKVNFTQAQVARVENFTRLRSFTCISAFPVDSAPTIPHNRGQRTTGGNRFAFVLCADDPQDHRVTGGNR